MASSSGTENFYVPSAGEALSLPKRTHRSGFLIAATAFAFSVGIFSWIQFSTPHIVDYDGYYHIKVAQLIRQHGLPTEFPWLPYTILDESRFTDHHLLFHILQIPFTYATDLRLAAKWSAVFFASCTCAFLVWLLWRYRVGYPLLWLVLIFASASPFLYRMSMPRAQSISLLLQALLFHLILQKRYRYVLLVCTIFVWTYNAFPTIAILVSIGFLVELASERKWDFHLLLYAAAGVLIGLVINPYFPNNIAFLWNHIGPKVFAGSYQTIVGSEWYPYSSWKLIELSNVALISFVLALVFTSRGEWINDKPRFFWILTAFVYLVLLMKSRRFIEYFPPTAVLALAFTARPWLQKKRLFEWIRTDMFVALLIAGTLLISFVFVRSVNAARNDVRSSKGWDNYRGAAEWLQKHTPENSIVFHADWDDFPMLFFFNTHNRYIVGLDADFMRLKNEPLYRKYEQITQGNIEDPVDIVLKVFRSEYVFTDNQHQKLIRNMQKSARVTEVYSDNHATIFRLRP